MKEFQELLSALQVGTRRVAPPVMEYVPTVPGANLAKQLLLQAGVTSLMIGAGTKSATDLVAIPEAPEETKPIAIASEEPLREAFDRNLKRAIKEWAEAAAAKGLVAPHRTILSLTSLSVDKPEGILPVLGARGLWLAEIGSVDLRPPEPDKWPQLRAENPQAFRTSLSAQLATLEWEEKRDALRAIQSGLSEDDAPLLEQSLQDRRKEVRSLAGETLATLPGSTVAQELIRLAESSVRHEKSLLKERLVVELPELEALPNWMPKPTGSKETGPKAEALRLLLGLVPPTHWEARFKTPPRKFFELAAKTDFPEPLTRGVAKAAIRFKNQAWIDEAFEREFEPNEIAPWVSQPLFDSNLTKFLMAGITWRPFILTSLLSRGQPYSRRLTAVIVDNFHPATWGDSIEELFYRMDPESAQGLKLDTPECAWTSKSQLEKLSHILPVRRRLLASLNQP